MATLTFYSGLKSQFEAFVEYKEGTQRWNRSSEYFLVCFDKYCALHYPFEQSLTEKMLSWCEERETEHGNSCSYRVSVIREFVRFAHKMKWTDLDLPTVPNYSTPQYSTSG